MAKPSHMGLGTSMILCRTHELAMARPHHGEASFRLPYTDRGKATTLEGFASLRDTTVPSS